MAKLLKMLSLLLVVSSLSGCQHQKDNTSKNGNETPQKGDVLGQILYLEDGTKIKPLSITIDGINISIAVEADLKGNVNEPRFYTDAFGFCDYISCDIVNLESKNKLDVKFKISIDYLENFENGVLVTSWCDFGLPRISDVDFEKSGKDENNGFSYYSWFCFTWVDCFIDENGVVIK